VTKLAFVDGIRSLISWSRINIGRSDPEAKNLSSTKHAQKHRRRSSLSMRETFDFAFSVGSLWSSIS
jgi:hypothetical protein